MQRALKRRRLLPAVGQQQLELEPAELLQQHTPPPPSMDGEDGLLEDDCMPSDVLAALLFLRGDVFGPQQALLPLLMLKSHIYTVVANRTDVDRDLDELRRKGSIRLFKLTSGVDEYGIMLSSDHAAIIDKLIQAAEAGQAAQQQDDQQHGASSSGRSPICLPAASAAHGLRAFLQHVLPACTDAKVPGQQLLQLLSRPVSTLQRPAAAICTSSKQPPHVDGRGSDGSSQHRPVVASAHSAAADAAVSQLLSAGLLLRDAVNPDCYVFTVPKAGVLVKSLINGRKELTSLLARKRYSEAPEKELYNKHKLRGSSLSMKYHVRDLLGRGVANKVATPSGSFIKLVKQ